MKDRNKTLTDHLTDSMPEVGKTSRSGFDASHMVLAAGSSIVIYTLVIVKATEYGLPMAVAAVLAWIAAFVWYRAIEGPFRKFVLVAWAYTLAKKDDAKNITDNIHRAGKSSIIMACFLGLATLALSIMVNPDITQGITKQEDSSIEIAQAGAATSSYDEDRQLLSNQLEAARKRDADRVKEAKSQAVLWIAQAEGSKGKEMRRLLHKGNGWAAKELSGAIRRATVKGDKHIQAARDAAEAPTLQAQLTGYVSTRSASRDTINQVTASLVSARQAQYVGAVSRRITTLNIVVLAALIAMLWFGRLVVISCIETGDKIDEDPGEGIMEAVRLRLGKINAHVGGIVGSSIDKKLKFAVAGKTVSKPSVPSPKLSVKPSATAPIAPAPATPTTPAAKPSVPSSVTVDVSVAGTVSELAVVFDGKEYSAAAAMDKMRKWYKHSKAAKKESTRTTNRKKYEAAKKGTSAYFTFKESVKSVKIEQR